VVVAAVVENAGFGAASAAPITRRVFDYLLMNQYPSEEDMAAMRKGAATAPLGKPRDAAEVAWPPGGAPLAAAPTQPATAAALPASAPAAALRRPVPADAAGAPALPLAAVPPRDILRTSVR